MQTTLNTHKIAVILVSLAFAGIGCGGDDSTGTTGPSGSGGSAGTTATTGGTAGTGGAATGTGGTGTGTGGAGGTGTSDAGGGCPSDGGSTEGGGGFPDCPQAFMCSLEKCGATLTKCFGPNFTQGDFSGGVCSSFMQCLFSCSTDCFSKITAECTACFEEEDACEKTNCADKQCDGGGYGQLEKIQALTGRAVTR